MTHTPPADDASERSVLLSIEELMVVPPSSRQLPDLSVSNDALRESLKPPPPVPLGTQVARVARARRDFALWWYTTRPAWLQVTLGGMAGSLLGLGVVLSYYVATLPPEPEVAAEPASSRIGLALAASAPLISERVVQALAPAAALDAPVEADALAETDLADEPTAKRDRRKSARRHASKAQASSAALPSWVKQHVKPSARRAELRDQKAAQRAKKAARAQKAAQARARKSKALAQK